MKRLYYLTRNIDALERISERLHEAGITDWNFHVLSKDKAGLTTHHIHSTTPLHERDIIRGGERGALIGAAAGLIAAIALMATDVVPTTTMGYLGMATLVIVFTLHGAWSGGLFGIQKQNYKIRQFHRELDEGQYLLMIDVKPAHEATVRSLLARHDATPVGDDTTTTVPWSKQRSTPF